MPSQPIDSSASVSSTAAVSERPWVLYCGAAPPISRIRFGDLQYRCLVLVVAERHFVGLDDGGVRECLTDVADVFGKIVEFVVHVIDSFEGVFDGFESIVEIETELLGGDIVLLQLLVVVLEFLDSFLEGVGIVIFLFVVVVLFFSEFGGLDDARCVLCSLCFFISVGAFDEVFLFEFVPSVADFAASGVGVVGPADGFGDVAGADGALFDGDSEDFDVLVCKFFHLCLLIGVGGG